MGTSPSTEKKLDDLGDVAERQQRKEAREAEETKEAQQQATKSQTSLKATQAKTAQQQNPQPQVPQTLSKYAQPQQVHPRAESPHSRANKEEVVEEVIDNTTAPPKSSMQELLNKYKKDLEKEKSSRWSKGHITMNFQGQAVPLGAQSPLNKQQQQQQQPSQPADTDAGTPSLESKLAVDMVITRKATNG